MGKTHTESNIIEQSPQTNYNFSNEQRSRQIEPKKVSKILDGQNLRTKQVLFTLRLNHLRDDHKKELEQLIAQFSNNFYLEEDELPFFPNIFKHEIYLTNEKPIYVKNYRFPIIHKEEVEKQTADYLKKGIIKKSKSLWNAPIWIVPKKHDASEKIKWRMVIDYRKLNEVTIDDKYPIPNIEEILDNLGNAKIFSTLDLANGFHQIPVRECDQEKTAFSTHEGHFEFTRMPFGLKNAPATFQRMINTIFSDLINKICFVYLDDIIVYSIDVETHFERLKQIFEKIKQYSLLIQPDKSEFMQNSVLYLGHIISSAGIQPNPEKVNVLKEYPQQFLGLTGFHRRFINNYAQIAKPITQLLKKNENFKWTINCQNAFKELFNILTSDIILMHPNFSKISYLYTDASQFAIGAVLQQKDKNDHLLPISYASRTLNRAEINYSTIEKEALAIIWSVKHFRPYLFGHKFEILSDHKPLIWLFKANDPGSRLLRWRLKLEYDYTISHISRSKNIVADTLSRIHNVTAITRSQQEKITKNLLDKNNCNSPEEFITFSCIDITQATNIVIFTTPDLLHTSMLTRLWN